MKMVEEEEEEEEEEEGGGVWCEIRCQQVKISNEMF